MLIEISYNYIFCIFKWELMTTKLDYFLEIKQILAYLNKNIAISEIILCFCL